MVKKYIISSHSTAKNMPKIAEVKVSSCGLWKKLRLRNCGCGATFLKKLRNCNCGSASFKLRNCNCGSASFKLRNCDCRLKKKLRVPTSANDIGKRTFVFVGWQKINGKRCLLIQQTCLSMSTDLFSCTALDNWHAPWVPKCRKKKFSPASLCSFPFVYNA